MSNTENDSDRLGEEVDQPLRFEAVLMGAGTILAFYTVSVVLRNGIPTPTGEQTWSNLPELLYEQAVADFGFVTEGVAKAWSGGYTLRLMVMVTAVALLVWGMYMTGKFGSFIIKHMEESENEQ